MILTNEPQKIGEVSLYLEKVDGVERVVVRFDAEYNGANFGLEGVIKDTRNTAQEATTDFRTFVRSKQFRGAITR